MERLTCKSCVFCQRDIDLCWCSKRSATEIVEISPDDEACSERFRRVRWYQKKDGTWTFEEIKR